MYVHPRPLHENFYCIATHLNFVQHVLIRSIWVLLTKLYHHLKTIEVTQSHILPRPLGTDHTPHLAQIDLLMNCGHDGVISL